MEARWDYFVHNLLGVEPPERNAVVAGTEGGGSRAGSARLRRPLSVALVRPYTPEEETCIWWRPRFSSRAGRAPRRARTSRLADSQTIRQPTRILAFSRRTNVHSAAGETSKTPGRFILTGSANVLFVPSSTMPSGERADQGQQGVRSGGGAGGGSRGRAARDHGGLGGAQAVGLFCAQLVWGWSRRRGMRWSRGRRGGGGSASVVAESPA
jgi:hypothetical protein